jgi:hypothetical protein
MKVLDYPQYNTTLLTDQEKERIRAEETIRYQAREEVKLRMAPTKKPLTHVREFFNSSLGIWMLSTLFIGYGTYQYKQLEEGSARRKEADRLEIELKHRLSLFNKVVDNLNREVNDTREQGNDPWGFKFASRLRDSYRAIQTGESAFFSNYGHDNVQALFTSLQDKLRGIDEKKAYLIDNCLEDLKLLRKRCEDDYNDVPVPSKAEVHAAYFEKVKLMIDDVQRTLKRAPLSLWVQHNAPKPE